MPTSSQRVTNRLQAHKGEFIVAGVIVLLLIVLRWFYARSQGWGSDEPQHLHVVWAWATGRLPYRDVFDNHSPLFHLLCSPFFRWFGERPDILVQMRMVLLPLFGLSLWCVYRLGRTVFSQRVGLWGAIFTALYCPFFFKMAEFRTDVLWTTLWLVTLVILTGGPLTRQRLFWAGVALGATFSVSMKTLLLLTTLLSAGGLTLALKSFTKENNTAPSRPFRSIAVDWALGITGLLIVPSLLLGYFAWQGALDSLYYCVIEHNTIPGAHKSSHVLKRITDFPNVLLFLVIPVFGGFLAIFSKERSHLKQRLFLVSATGLFYPILHGLWSMITPQDYIPWYPLLILTLAAAVLWLTDRSGKKFVQPTVLCLLIALEFLWMFDEHTPFSIRQNKHIEEIAQALQLTQSNEFLMDAKGEVIFRPRPYYYVLETLTRKRLDLGLLSDELPQRLTETRTAVVFPSSRMTPASLDFIKQNYIPVSKLYVLGQQLKTEANGTVRFHITIPAQYVVVDKDGIVPATLDDSPITNSRWIEPGEHTLKVESPNDREVALVWTRAIDLGFSPFHKPPVFFLED